MNSDEQTKLLTETREMVRQQAEKFEKFTKTVIRRQLFGLLLTAMTAGVLMGVAIAFIRIVSATSNRIEAKTLKILSQTERMLEQTKKKIETQRQIPQNQREPV